MKTVQRSYLPGSHWLYFKIYTGIVTADRILANEIIKFIGKLKLEGLITKWFFIRYTDPDFHLRVRVHVKDVSDIGTVILLFHTIMKRLEARNLIWKVQIDTYQRELERYHEKLIEDTESFFYVDSEYTVKIIQKILVHTEDYRWIIAFKMIDSLLSDFLFTVEQKLNLMERQSIAFKKEFGFDEFNAKQFNTKYRDCMKSINNVMQEKKDVDEPLKLMIADIHKRSVDLKPVFLTVIQKSKKNGIDYLTLPAHYIHMMLNRLFYEKARMHELIMYEFLRRYYASEIARSRNNGKQIAP
jgi:thiopeptide-type bacteriocin biosynthesis protein